MMHSTEKKLQQLQRMAECAYLNGFDFKESPRFDAQVLINEMREAIIQEMILATARLARAFLRPLVITIVMTSFCFAPNFFEYQFSVRG